ncbi:MAG: aldo/keto reductase [Prevotella sp.]|nr:aldo/keto reductase [Prevotella sp.]MBR3079628.1 aldo/keto reductase [Prevotella sp.]
MKKQDISRRSFLKLLGGGALATAAVVTGCKPKTGSQTDSEYARQVEPPVGKMTYRTNPFNGDKVSLLGYGMMRLPSKTENKDDYDQDMINRQIDYAIEHGVNYFDTSPVYCQGKSEACTGIALSRHKRSEYFVATKLSNFNPATHSREASMAMYHNSMRELQVDYIDYYLLHAIGGGMEEFSRRYVDNGMMDFLMEERKAGRIRNLGFSFHGYQNVFDEVLAMHDKYHWDFVQIELNYLDWNFANEINDRNVDASYLYEELQKKGIPSVVMEPLLGGRLANLPQYLASELKQHDAERSIASWAFRYAGTPEGVLTVLSGMTYMEHLKDNLLSYCPLVPLTEKEQTYLDKDVAERIVGLENIPCNDCKYCMPCPYGIDIPAIFVHYNKCKNEGTLPLDSGDANYRELRRQYLIGLERKVPKMRQADHCVGCGQCEPHCPQNIRIVRELRLISNFVESLKQDTLTRTKGEKKKA